MGCEQLVDLFGKRKLEDQIAELERSIEDLQAENQELLRTVEKREEKIKKLSSAYQEACLALKTCEQKPQAQPQSRTEKAEEPQILGAKLSLREMEKLLERLFAFSLPEEDLLTAYLPPSESLPSELPQSAMKPLQALKSPRGWVVLHCPLLFTLLLQPPFPVRDHSISIGRRLQLEPLKDMLETPVMVISAHAGDTFLGIALSKERFEVQEIVTSQVKEKHSKGGWSQKRFERLREEDIKNHREALLQRLSEMREKYGSISKFAVLGGDAVLLKQIAPKVGLPIVERKLERHDEKRPDLLLNQVYGFTCYRI